MIGGYLVAADGAIGGSHERDRLLVDIEFDTLECCVYGGS